MNEQDYIRQVEIGGIKVEVDLRTVKHITTYKVGDNVKLLMKEYSNFVVKPGVIVDFVNFKENPAIVVAYFDQNYAGTSIKFVTIHKDTTDIEMAPCLPHELELNKDRVLDRFDLEIANKLRDAEELRQKKEYFVKNFGRFFKEEEK